MTEKRQRQCRRYDLSNMIQENVETKYLRPIRYLPAPPGAVGASATAELVMTVNAPATASTREQLPTRLPFPARTVLGSVEPCMQVSTLSLLPFPFVLQSPTPPVPPTLSCPP